MLTYGSLFSGAGMFDLGFDRAGLRCAWQVEIDDYATRILERRFPGVRRHRDVRTFARDSVDQWRVPIIAGGFPCKNTSTASAVHGKRQGLDGPDSGLWHEMLRVVRSIKPEWVVVENVGGAASYSEAIQRGLAEAGLVVPDEPLELSAAMFGLPHKRRRLFWIADRDGKGLAIARQGGPSEAERQSWRTAAGNPWLPSLARTVRVDDGPAGGLDRRKRIECIGNGCCPVKAEWIGRRILEACEATHDPH